MKRSQKTVTILVIVLIAIVVAAMVYVYHRFSAKPTAGEKEITISITDADGAEKTHRLTTDAEYLLEALREVAEVGGEETDQGFTLYTINGVTADFNTDQAYWSVYVNGEYGAYSIDKQPVQDGDSFAIVYAQF